MYKKVTLHIAASVILFFTVACTPVTSSINQTALALIGPSDSGEVAPSETLQKVAYTAKQPKIFKSIFVTRPDNIWDRLRNDFKFTHYTKNATVEHYIRYYQKNPKSLKRTIARSAPYIYYITEQLEARNLPGELALLPIIESAYNPTANSPNNAAGLWQIIPSTGKHLGLTRTNNYDGRRDVIKATDAALTYLEFLHNTFGDWELALAGYNTGEGNVAKQIRRNKHAGLPTDFWHLRLAKETRGYVPNFVALAIIFSDPQKYGVDIQPIPNKPYLTVVNVDSNVNFKQLTKFAGLTEAQMHNLNPGFVTYAKSSLNNYDILLPIDRLANYEVNKNAYETSGYVNYASNDDVDYGVKAVSFDLGSDDKKKAIHVVKKGDSLWKIGNKYGVDWKHIRHWNSLSPQHKIYPGQELVILMPA